MGSEPATKSLPPNADVATSASAHLLEPERGTRLGRYELLLPIASGGMGRVWAATQLGELGFQRLVAVKTIRPDRADDPSLRAMFLDEARLAARIRHANVVEVIDLGEERLGEEGAIVYAVMPLIEGDSLAGLQRRWRARGEEQLPVDVVVRIAIDVLRGLHAAHEITDDDGNALHLVHRDVSPQNVLVGVDGVAKLTDFGVAKALGRLAEETQTGELRGKYSYLSPEQADRTPIDRRSDVFATGIVLWEALTGSRLFTGADPVETLVRVRGAQIVDPCTRRRELPSEIGAVVLRMLERDARRRFPTADAAADALERVAKSTGISASPKEVASFVHDLVGHDLHRRREAIRAAMRRSSPGFERAPTIAEPPHDDTTTIADTNAAKPITPTSRARGLGVTLAVIVALLFAGVGVGVGAMRARSHADDAPHGAPITSTSTVTTSAPLVQSATPVESTTTSAPPTTSPTTSPTMSATVSATAKKPATKGVAHPTKPTTTSAPTSQPKFGNPYGP